MISLALAVPAALMFVAGGVVKGTLGVGLPLLVVPLLTLILPASQAMGLLVMPVLVANIYQALQGGLWRISVRRFGTLMLAQATTTLLAIHWSIGWSGKSLDKAMGVTVLVAVAVMILQPKGTISAAQEKWLGPLVGALAGAMAGMSSLTGPLLITYMMALRLPRDVFVGSISVVYLLGALPMYAGMIWWGRFGWSEVGWSTLALLPVYAGLLIGTSVRKRLNEKQFRLLLLVLLLFLGTLLLVR